MTLAVRPLLDSPAEPAVMCCAPLVREPLSAAGARAVRGVFWRRWRPGAACRRRPSLRCFTDWFRVV